MNLHYAGPLKLVSVVAEVSIADEKAHTEVDYTFSNPTAQLVQARAMVTCAGLAALRSRLGRPGPQRPLRPRPPPGRMETPVTQALALKLGAGEQHVVEISSAVEGATPAVHSHQFVPDLRLDDRPLTDPVDELRLTMRLPASAQRVVWSSVAPTSVQRTTEGLVCEFVQHKALLLPLTVKWTDSKVDVTVRRSAALGPDNWITVALTVSNHGDLPVSDLMVEDNWTAGQVIAFQGLGVTRERSNDKDERVVFRQAVSLAARHSTQLSYQVRGIGAGVSVPTTTVTHGGALVARGEQPRWIPLPPPPPAPMAAFALPAGWSFDYLHGGDHHLNEHGMWCTGQNLDPRTGTLSWTTGTIYADKNLDDDYRWSVAHQVLRAQPGFAFHGGTAWLAKSGATSLHDGSFQSDALKAFSQCVVLLRGWRFDFSSDDHHINQIAFRIDTTGFDRAAGLVSWRASATYADKNFDDGYRWQYEYTVLGYNGKLRIADFAGTDGGGGTHDVMGSMTDASLAGLMHVCAIPIGWSFDFKSDDHHINEHDFRITNLQWNPAGSAATWMAHLNYADKNFDDPYTWRYTLAFIASNDVQAREVTGGPYTDNGGLDSENFSVGLNQLFVPVTWTNGVQDGDETGVDSGGSSPARHIECLPGAVDPGNASDAGLFSLANSDQFNVVRTFATVALMEYAQAKNKPYPSWYAGVTEADQYVEAIAWYVDQHMDYVKDDWPSWSGAQSAYRTLTESGHRGSKDFAGDCEDHAILRAALLRSLGFTPRHLFCADHHNSNDQGQCTECGAGKKGSGGHTYNVVLYQGKYRIMDYGPMMARWWSLQRCWDQHATDNLWNDHTGEHWDRQDVSPFGSQPLVNYPGNPSSPSANWDWRTYFNDITP